MLFKVEYEDTHGQWHIPGNTWKHRVNIMNLPGRSSYPCHLYHNVLFIISNFTKVNAYIMWDASWALFLRWSVTIQRNVGLILGRLGLSCYYPKGYNCLPMLMGCLGGNVLELFTVILASLRSAHDLTKMPPPLFSWSHSLSSFLTGAYCDSLLPALALAPLHCPQSSMCKTLTWSCHFYVWNHSMASTSCRIK